MQNWCHVWKKYVKYREKKLFDKPRPKGNVKEPICIVI